jgi:hypothetical protein
MITLHLVYGTEITTCRYKGLLHEYVVVVDVFPPSHMIYLLRNTVTNTHNMCIILIIVPVLRPPPCSDLRTKSDLTIDASDVVGNIIVCVILVVLEDDQRVGHL